MVFVLTQFYYTGLIAFPETSMQPDALCLPVSKTESITMQYFIYLFIKYQDSFIMDDDY
jgi:hypothetical protein